MKTNSLRLLVALVASFGLYPAAALRAGSIELPSISAEAGHIYIENRTDAVVRFLLESERTESTVHALDPNSGATFTGQPGDSWFNVTITSSKTVKYGVDAGGRYYLAWNGDVLDLYTMPAQGG